MVTTPDHSQRRRDSQQRRDAARQVTAPLTLAVSLRTIRKGWMQLTLEDFSQQLFKIAGRRCSPEHLSMIENGKRAPSAELAAALEHTIEVFEQRPVAELVAALEHLIETFRRKPTTNLLTALERLIDAYKPGSKDNAA